MGPIRFATMAVGCLAAASSADVISFMDHRDPRVTGDSSVEALLVARSTTNSSAFASALFENRPSARLAVGPLVSPATRSGQEKAPAAEPSLFLPQQDFWTGMLARSTAMMF